MKVLWITNDVIDPFLPYVKGNPTIGGSWINPLFFSISRQLHIKLGVVTPITNGEYFHKEIDGIHYYSIPNQSGANVKQLTPTLIKYYQIVINKFNPDVIHIHGTEKNFGLLRNFVKNEIPIICSIQGIINGYEDYLKMSMSTIPYKKYKSFKNYFIRGGLDALTRRWKKYRLIEQQIFKINNYFIGRTVWDKAQTLQLNRHATYFHGEELLREVFYRESWNISTCERHSIFISSGAYPIKGLHVIIKSLAVIREHFSDVKLYVPVFPGIKAGGFRSLIFGEDYYNYIDSLVRNLGLQANIVFFSRLSAEEMAAMFVRAHVFVMPSFIENSPNSLGEAMMIGTPTIVSYTGGIESIVENNKSSLVIPIGDHSALAFKAIELFENDDLAQKISRTARETARKRHDIENSTQDYLSIYSEVIRINNEGITHLQ